MAFKFLTWDYKLIWFCYSGNTRVNVNLYKKRKIEDHSTGLVFSAMRFLLECKVIHEGTYLEIFYQVVFFGISRKFQR